MADALNPKIDELASSIPISNGPYKVTRDTLVAQARSAISQYSAAESTLASAADKMQATARKIVADTNAQIHTPNTSPATATALLKSEMALFTPASPVSSSKLTAQGGLGKKDVDASLSELDDFRTKLNEFGRSCLIPQPASVSAFDACTTYSPTVPAAPNITTTLDGNQATLKPGDQLAFTATSNPSGTPWATYTKNASVAQQVLGDPQQITLSPTQTRVTLTYDKTKPVSEDVQVTLSLNTMGVPGNPTSVNLTLKAAAGNAGAGGQPKADLSKATGDKGVMEVLDLGTDPNAAIVQSALETKWRMACGVAPTVTPTITQLVNTDFLTAVKKKAAPDQNQAFCKST